MKLPRRCARLESFRGVGRSAKRWRVQFRASAAAEHIARDQDAGSNGLCGELLRCELPYASPFGTPDDDSVFLFRT